MIIAKLFLGCYASLTTVATVVGSLEQKLINHLFVNYSTSVRPVLNPEERIDVSFTMYLRHLQSIDGQKQTMTVQVDYAVSWMNDLLRWNPKEWGDIESLYINEEKIWTPDLVLINNCNREAAEPHKGTGNIILSSNGLNTWYPILTLSVTFKFNVEYFPFDHQECTLKFGSWIYDVSKVNLVKTNDSLISQYYVTSPEWEIVKTEANVHRKFYENHSDPFSQMHFTYHLSRKPLYYCVTLIFPCIVLIAILLMNHFLPPSSGERMGVVITVMLAFAVFLEVVSSSLPRNSESTSVLSAFYLTTMIINALSFFATCIVYSILHQVDRNYPPLWIRKYIIRSLRVTTIEVEEAHSNSAMKGFFVSQNSIETDTSTYTSASNTPNLRRAEDKLLEPACSPEILDCLKSIIERQNAFVDLMKQKKDRDKSMKLMLTQREQIEKEWLTFAGFIDRVCFVIFLLLYIIALCMILLPAYYRTQRPGHS